MGVLSENQKNALHSASLEILQRTGVSVRLDDTRNRLAKAGCQVDNDRVFIPERLIEWALNQHPKHVVLCDRNATPAMALEGRNCYFGTGSDTPFVIDINSGLHRSAVIADIENVSRLADALHNLDFLMCMGIASDVRPEISDLYHFQAMVSNTIKPIVFTAWNASNLEAILRMAETVAGSLENLLRYPFVALYAEPTAPLIHSQIGCEKLEVICRLGLPLVYTPGLITGASSPVSHAGAIVVANAEILSGLLITQLINPGTPVIAGGGGMMTMDMHSMIASYGAPEFMFDWCSLREMGAFYGLPVFGFAGVSDALIFDQQAGIEGALWTLISALSGGNLIHDVGYLESGLTTSYEMIVAMDETIGLVKRFMQGMLVNNDTLAINTIASVGPGGHFLDVPHTLDHFRENWRPDIFCHSNRPDWNEAGASPLGDRALRKVKTILSQHKPEPLPQHVTENIKSIINNATSRLGRMD
ncbi:hypothetical protein A2W24_01055 [Microgenomates group bacterium RBG_16_45_19]|nr:MAG: hypothetical protein A2W24_01055 [Microgenomates group bacterium RBG_16_45_19]